MAEGLPYPFGTPHHISRKNSFPPRGLVGQSEGVGTVTTDNSCQQVGSAPWLHSAHNGWPGRGESREGSRAKEGLRELTAICCYPLFFCCDVLVMQAADCYPASESHPIAATPRLLATSRERCARREEIATERCLHPSRRILLVQTGFRFFLER